MLEGIRIHGLTELKEHKSEDDRNCGHRNSSEKCAEEKLRRTQRGHLTKSFESAQFLHKNMCIERNLNLKDTSIIKPDWNNRFVHLEMVCAKGIQGLEVLG